MSSGPEKRRLPPTHGDSEQLRVSAWHSCGIEAVTRTSYRRRGNMDANTTNNANGTPISGWEDEGGAGRADDRPEEERRDKRDGDETVPSRPNDEVPANRREDPANEGRDQDTERKDRRSSS